MWMTDDTLMLEKKITILTWLVWAINVSAPFDSTGHAGHAFSGPEHEEIPRSSNKNQGNVLAGWFIGLV